MIEFPCRCGHYTFSVPTEMAGDPIQCPECRRLVDVPLLSELPSIETDGSIRIGQEQEVPHGEEVLRQSMRAFTRDHVDAQGNEIDLRPTFDEVLESHGSAPARAQIENASHDDIPVAELVPPPPERPRYDPTTGELIEPLDIKPDDLPHRPHPILAAQKESGVLNYARESLAEPVKLRSIPWLLLRPVNIFVMIIILVAHLLVIPVNLMMLAGLFLVAPLWIMAWMFFLSHYSAVIEEVGPGDQDELPRPMRDFSFSEDIWRPFTHTGGAMIICYGLAFIAFAAGVPHAIVWALAGAGTFFLPAIVLTLSTSGSTHNLRPDRVMGVIRVIGYAYLPLLLTLAIAATTYYLGLWRLEMDLLLLFAMRADAQAARASAAWWFTPALMYPCLLVGIFSMHAFCYALGLLYRAHQPQFPWILQHHVPTKMAARMQRSPQRDPNANSNAARARMAQPLAPPKLPR